MLRAFKVLLALALVLGSLIVVGCGGGDSTGTQTTKSRRARDGRVFVRNAHESTITVKFFNKDKGATVETTIEPGKSAEVTQAVIPGGTEVTLTIKGPVNRVISPNQTSEKDIKVKIDGDVTVTVTNIRSGQVDYTVQ